MIKNYLKIAWRSLNKSKGLFAINVVGLSLGIASCLMIALFVLDELSYDRFYDKSDQIVRVVLKAKIGDEIIKEAGIMAPVGQVLEQEIPEVAASTRILKVTDRTKVVTGDRTLRKGKMALVDPNFLEFFSLSLIKGDANTLLTMPNTIVLTQEQAKAYFGDADPLNKTIAIEDIGIYGTEGYQDLSGPYTVTGIIDKIPANSHFHFDLMASMQGYTNATNQSWLSGSYHTYLLTADGTKVGELESKMPAIIEKYMGPQLETALGMTYTEMLEKNDHVGFHVQPLTAIHLHSDVTGEFEEGGNGNTVYLFAIIALFMLVIACINFMNLSTAGASKRAREIGMRKVLGSERRQLIFQFLAESFLATLLAMILGVLLFALTIPYFNNLANKAFEFGKVLDIKFLVGLSVLTVLISLLAGAYPAFFMSNFRPLQALRNRFSLQGGKGIRSGLVVFQFAISSCLIVGTLVVGLQMRYIQNKDVGYDKEGLIVVRNAGFLGERLNTFKEAVAQDSRVVHITTSAYVPAGPTDQSASLISYNKKNAPKSRIQIYRIDGEYISALGMELLQGRNFSDDFGTEENNIIINETAVKRFGIEGNPIGQTMIESTDNQGSTNPLRIIGVVKDFNTRSLHEPIEPLMMKYEPYYGIMVRANKADIKGLLGYMEEQWDSFGPTEAFEYAFLDELYNETHIKEQKMGTILTVFALLTILVACLGLFGLVTFTAERRFKEIGVRKVLGSSISQIVSMLSYDFLKLVAISFLIAFPLGYILMKKWLEGFAYRIEITWWIFALAALITVLIAFATVSFKSFQAARINPAKSLRTE